MLNFVDLSRLHKQQMESAIEAHKKELEELQKQHAEEIKKLLVTTNIVLFYFMYYFMYYVVC